MSYSFPIKRQKTYLSCTGLAILGGPSLWRGLHQSGKAWFACLTQRSWKSSTLYQGSTMAQDSSWKLTKFSSFMTCKTLVLKSHGLTTAILLTDYESCCSLASEFVFFLQVASAALGAVPLL